MKSFAIDLSVIKDYEEPGDAERAFVSIKELLEREIPSCVVELIEVNELADPEDYK